MITGRDTGSTKNITVTRRRTPVLDRRAVLLDHLAAILDSASRGKCCSRASAVWRELDRLSDGELMEMLRERGKLEKFAAAVEAKSVECTASRTSELEMLGNLLFEKVSEVETELCAQITGMLLELDPATIEKLLSEPSTLQCAVTKAKEEYLKERHPHWLPPGENVADDIFEKVYRIYPRNAPQITGMLLELPVAHIHLLLQDSAELASRVQASSKALQSVGKWRSE